MQIYIDQSSKLEDTSQDTVVAYANSQQKSLMIKAEDKRRIRQIFREAGKPHMYIYKTFAVLVFLLIKRDLPKIQEIIIDREYSGKEWLIKQLLLEIIWRHGILMDKDDISFDMIGKKNAAHTKAINTFRGNISADLQASFKDVYLYLL